MSLAEIVRVCGGDLYSSGLRASIPAPGHSPADRSASLVIGRTGRVVVYSFGRSSVGDILAELREQGLVDRLGFPRNAPDRPTSSQVLTDLSRIETARDLWSRGILIAGTLSERHLIGRGLDAESFRWARLLHNLECPFSVYGGRSRTGPALMAEILTPDGKLTAVELTYLDPHGLRDRRCRISRKTVGMVPPGAYVDLGPAGTHLVVGEGVVTTLSAMQIFRLPGRALLGARNMPRFVPPDGVAEVTIAADRGEAGEGAANRLHERLCRRGVRASVRLPDEPFDDFNAMLAASLRKRGGRSGAVWSGE
jgi:hypothetical protein